MTKSILDQIQYLTIRIEAIAPDGSSSLGTGLHFGTNHPTKGQLPCVITNKHVIGNADSVIIHVNETVDGVNPSYGNHKGWKLDGVQRECVKHPDPNVDLAAFPIGDILNLMTQRGIKPFLRQFSINDIPSIEIISTLRSVEDVTMIGYPTGLWDSKNNLPIVRRGITATPYAIDYEGRKEFIIDTACFPGSSGSPIIIVNDGIFIDASGSPVHGQRFIFLGVLWGGPQYTAEGKIVARPVPTNQVPIALSSIPTNLGFCIKSARIAEMCPLMLDKWKD